MPPDSRLLIAGATSSIARALVRRLSARGATLHLAARNVDEAERIGRDAQVRFGVDASWSAYDVTDPNAHDAVLDAATEAMGRLDGVVVAVGMLGDAERARHDPAYLRTVIDVNFTSVAHLLTRAADRLEAQGRGVIAAFSSVAGDRGRASNYVYGSAKAGLSAFLQGLRARLHPHGVHVLTVKPGPVDTRMTFGHDDLPLLTDPDAVAADVVDALERQTDVLYTPGIWRWIMTALRALPERVFKRLPL